MMHNLFTVPLPFIGEVFFQWDTITMSRWSIEPEDYGFGVEPLVCCGKLRLYFTPSTVQKARRNYHQEQ